MTVNRPKKHEQLNANPNFDLQQNFQVGKVEHVGDSPLPSLPPFNPAALKFWEDNKPGDGYVWIEKSALDKLAAMVDESEEFHGHMYDLARRENDGLFEALIAAVGLEPAKDIRYKVIQEARKKHREAKKRNE